MYMDMDNDEIQKGTLTGVKVQFVMDGVEYRCTADLNWRYGDNEILNCDVTYTEDVIRVADGYQLWDDEADEWEAKLIHQCAYGIINPFDDAIMGEVVDYSLYD